MIFILICRWFQKSNPRDQHSNGQIWRFEQTSRYSTERTVFMQKMMKNQQFMNVLFTQQMCERNGTDCSTTDDMIQTSLSSVNQYTMILHS